ncbi:hypothetical protein EDD22DRAFT_947964 [Suillus occidentalis]|nr:hypothetical protein EDD22DRAFT_947964 [Suillus occidentalis]
MEPPSTPLKTLKAVLEVTCSNDNDESNSEEHAAIITETGKGKAAMKTVIEIDSSTDIELHTALIAGHGKNKTATSSSTNTSSLQESDADNNTVLNLPLSGTPFADLPYDRQLEIVSFALEQKPHTSKRKIEEDGDDLMEFGDSRDDAMNLDSDIKDAPIYGVDCTTTATSVIAIEKPLVLQPAKKCKSEPSQTSTMAMKVLYPAKKVKSEPAFKTLTGATVPAVPESMLTDMAIKPVTGNGQW